MFLFKVITLMATISTMDHQKSMSDMNDTNDLIGKWKIDLTPHISTDENFASMNITKVEGTQFFGEFYRDGVKIRNGQINKNHHIHAALISKDNSGQYNTSFYLKSGVLYGTTHAVDRGFLSVWTAIKQ